MFLNEYKKISMNKIITLITLLFIFSVVTYSQQQQEAFSKPFRWNVKNKQEILRQLQEDNRKFKEIWQQELEERRSELSESQKVSDAIQIEVQPKVELATANDGGQEMNLIINFNYSTIVNDENIRFNVSQRTDDYPPGAYNSALSNACRLTLDFVKTKMETDLLKYLKPGTRVSIKITGETDGTPINSRLPYKGEYGDFYNKMIFLNGALSDITITKATGITTNAQLAFLRTQGVEDFLKTYVEPLQHTKNTFRIYAVENRGRGDEFRKISIEVTIHGAFNDVANIEPISDEDFVSDIDQNIPTRNITNNDLFVLIIANENYANPVPDVPFAINDGKSFATYCEKTLGAPQRQIMYIENGTGNQINDGIERIISLLRSTGGSGKAIIYYAGHGIPNPESNEAFIIPVDANPSRFNQLISLNALYNTLGAVHSESILVVLDACFSGTRRNGEMILEGTRSVRIRPRDGIPQGNTIVISATDGYQTAQPLREQKHGLFTYHFLKTLQDSKGDITLGEWFERVRRTVTRESILHLNEQTPTVTVSPAIEGSWNNKKF